MGRAGSLGGGTRRRCRLGCSFPTQPIFLCHSYGAGVDSIGSLCFGESTTRGGMHIRLRRWDAHQASRPR